MRKLPFCCYIWMESKEEVAFIIRGSKRYVTLVRAEGEKYVKRANENLCVTPAQASAMLVGVLFGWHVPGADPGLYDEEGKILPKKIRGGV
jgi:hypothetical protein